MRRNKLLLFALLCCLFIIPIKINAASLLSGINIDGIGDLNMSKKSWTYSFTTTLDYANVTATASDSSTKIEGAGKVEIKEGANQIVITATNGSQSETYTITLNVTKGNSTSSTTYDKDGNEINNPPTGAFANYAFIGSGIVISLITIAYLRKNKKFFNI